MGIRVARVEAGAAGAGPEGVAHLAWGAKEVDLAKGGAGGQGAEEVVKALEMEEGTEEGEEGADEAEEGEGSVAREGTRQRWGETAPAHSWLYFLQPCSQWRRAAARSSCRGGCAP